MSHQPPRDPADFSAEDLVYSRRIFASIMIIGLILLVALALPSLRELFAG
jgi:hypothetical protein